MKLFEVLLFIQILKVNAVHKDIVCYTNLKV